ncbi:MAG: DUF302 domain-containing protein [Acidimicrobiales bacterium]
MGAPEFFGISHLDLSVSDVEASAPWYARVLGLRHLRRVDFPQRTMIVLAHERSGLVIGLNQHQGFPGKPFDERRAGLDHVGFAIAERGDLDRWEEHLGSLGVTHSPVADVEAGSALVFRDPDNIQLEMWWSRARPGATPAAGTGELVERSSPYDVAQTVQRLVGTAASSGVTIFASIDHAAGARSAGLDMPETRVLILGNPAAGSPAMLAAPDLALDLPTRLLVREAPAGTPGASVAFHDPASIARRHALTPAQEAGLRGIVEIVERALGPEA